MVVDIEQFLLLMELEAPFEKRDVQVARRKMAKRWHPDLAPPGKRPEHERHIKAINEAADQLEQLAEQSRGGVVSKNAVRASAAATRQARADAGRRAYEAQQRAHEENENREKHDPFAGQVPEHSVVHRYARCLSYPEWGVGSVTGIHFSGEGDNTQQWARVLFSVGVRTVPAGSLQFVDFSKPDPGAERVQRFVTAAQHSMAEGEYGIAAKRLIYARDADPKDVTVLRLLTFAFWQDGNNEAAARAVRDWMRVEPKNPIAHRYAARVYESMGVLSLAISSLENLVKLLPKDATAWERIGRLRLQQSELLLATKALEHARKLEPSVEGLLDLALAYQLTDNLGGEVTAAQQATLIDPKSIEAWSRYAHALARTDRTTECITACEQALKLDPNDDEVSQLLTHAKAAEQRKLTGQAEA